jgi:hypothetical protein
MDAKWLDVFAQLVSRLDLDNDSMTNATSNPMQTERNRFSIPAMKNNQYTDALYGIPATTEKNTFGTDVSNYEVQSFIKFVTGAQPLTDTTWADYVSTWKNKGGQGIVDSMVKEYNSIKGTKYTSGN